MKKNKDDIDFGVYLQTQLEIDNLKKEQTKQQKRLWLRTKINEITGISDSSDSYKVAIFEEIFEWIYQAPIYEWEGMLYCLNHETWLFSSRDNHNSLNKAKRLYSFLK